MSIVDRREVKLVLPRSGPEDIWKQIVDEFAGDDPLKWKYLAMLALRENGGWPLHWIGMAFHHPKGHVTRCLARVKQQLRAHFPAEELSVDALERRAG